MNQYSIKYQITPNQAPLLDCNKAGIDRIFWQAGQWKLCCRPMPEGIEQTVLLAVEQFAFLLWGLDARNGACFSFACLADHIRNRFSLENPRTRQSVDALMWCYNRDDRSGEPDCVI